MSYKIFTPIVMVALLGLPSCASSIITPFSTPKPFAASSYCLAAGGNAPLEIPETVTAALDDENGQFSDEVVAEALLTKAAIEIAHAATAPEDCQSALEKGQKMFLSVLAGQQKTLGDIGEFKPSKDTKILDVQTQLTRLWREDQAARGAYLGLSTDDKTGAGFWAQRLATAHTVHTDSESVGYMKGLLSAYDWIDNKRFGSRISAHAWLLVQHADDDPDFQALALGRMEPYLKSGQVKPANYAFLWDRVAVNTGKKQRYGTQPTWECTDGKLELQPLEDPDNVNKRRAAMNMDTVEEGLENMAREVCR